MKLPWLPHLSFAAFILVPLLAASAPADDSPAEADKGAARRYVDQGKADRRLTGIRTPEGFRLEIVAESPTVTRPAALAFAADGRTFFLDEGAGGYGPAESLEVVYKDGSSRIFPMRAKKAPDRVKALIASRVGGTWDSSRTVVSVVQATALLAYNEWLYVAGRGAVHRFKRHESGDKFAPRQLVAHGFCADGPYDVSGLAIGPDGSLYVTAGAGDHYAEGSDGSRATVLRTGAVFRCRPDGSGLHAFATGLENPRGPAFDATGHVFLADAHRGPRFGVSGYRLLHAADGADFGYWRAPGPRAVADRDRSTLSGDRPGAMAPMLSSNKGLPGGALICNDPVLPEFVRGLLLVPDSTAGAVRAFRLEPSGASFRAAAAFDLVAAAKGTACRPRQVAAGPDGALYLADESGRICRLTWSGTREAPAIALRRPDSGAKVVGLADAELIKTLSGDDPSLREVARRELVRRGEKNRPALIELLSNEEAPVAARLTTVGALTAMYDGGVQKALLAALGEGDDELGRAAAAALGSNAKRGDADVHAALLRAMAVEDRDVRRTVAIALGRLAGPGAADSLAAALAFDGGKDRFYADGLVRALEMLGKPGIRALLSLADSGVQAKTDLVAATFLGLRSRAAFEALPGLLRNPHLGTEQRVALVRSCLNYVFAERPSLEGVVTVIDSAGEDESVKRALLEVLAVPGFARGPRSAAFVLAQLRGRDLAARRAAAEAAVHLRLKGASAVLVKALAGDLADRERRTVVWALGRVGTGDPSATEAVQRELRREAPAVRVEALRSLDSLAGAAAAREAMALLGDADSEVQREAIRVAARSTTGAKEVGRRWMTGKLPRELRRDVTATLKRHAATDADCARLLDEVKKAPRER